MNDAEIRLSSGEIAMIDRDLVDLVNCFTWHCEWRGARRYSVAYHTGRKFYLHDFVVSAAIANNPGATAGFAQHLEA